MNNTTTHHHFCCSTIHGGKLHASRRFYEGERSHASRRFCECGKRNFDQCATPQVRAYGDVKAHKENADDAPSHSIFRTPARLKTAYDCQRMVMPYEQKLSRPTMNFGAMRSLCSTAAEYSLLTRYHCNFTLPHISMA